MLHFEGPLKDWSRFEDDQHLEKRFQHESRILDFSSRSYERSLHDVKVSNYGDDLCYCAKSLFNTDLTQMNKSS